MSAQPSTPAATRFEITSANLTFFADCLRLEAFDDLRRFFVAASADGRSRVAAPIVFDVPKQDADAYRRAVEAFNAIVDEHQTKIARCNTRRRMRRVLARHTLAETV